MTSHQNKITQTIFSSILFSPSKNLVEDRSLECNACENSVGNLSSSSEAESWKGEFGSWREAWNNAQTDVSTAIVAVCPTTRATNTVKLSTICTFAPWTTIRSDDCQLPQFTFGSRYVGTIELCFNWMYVESIIMSIDFTVWGYLSVLIFIIIVCLPSHFCFFVL